MFSLLTAIRRLHQRYIGIGCYCIALLISFKLQKYYQKRSRTLDVAHVDKVHRRLVASSATSAEDKEDYAESGCESDVVDELFLTPVSSTS